MSKEPLKDREHLAAVAGQISSILQKNGVQPDEVHSVFELVLQQQVKAVDKLALVEQATPAVEISPTDIRLVNFNCDLYYGQDLTEERQEIRARALSLVPDVLGMHISVHQNPNTYLFRNESGNLEGVTYAFRETQEINFLKVLANYPKMPRPFNLENFDPQRAQKLGQLNSAGLQLFRIMRDATSQVVKESDLDQRDYCVIDVHNPDGSSRNELLIVAKFGEQGSEPRANSGCISIFFNPGKKEEFISLIEKSPYDAIIGLAQGVLSPDVSNLEIDNPKSESRKSLLFIHPCQKLDIIQAKPVQGNIVYLQRI